MIRRCFVLGISGLAALALGACSSVDNTEHSPSPSDPTLGETGSTEPVQAPEAAEGEGRDVSGLDLAPAWTEYALGTHGGDGGSFAAHVTNGVIYGVQINAGKYVDHIRFAYYLPSNPDNLYRSGDFFGTTAAYGGNGGAAYWVYCPAGQGVIGLRGASGALVDRLGVVCGNVTNPNPYDAGNWYSNVYGGGGGGWFSDLCAAGYLMNSANVRSGTLLDRIQGICIRAR